MIPDNLVLLDQPRSGVPDTLVDLFCGAGGSGGGLLEANKILNRDVAGTFVNHWDAAIDIHTANHPEHRHMREDLFKLDPKSVSPPSPGCSLMWASPSCQHFSVAKGAACVSEQERSHGHSVLDWVDHVRPDCLIVENVPEWLSWGPTLQKRRKVRRGKGELMWAKSSKPVRLLPKGHARRRTPREAEASWSSRMEGLGYAPYMVPDKSRAGEYFSAWVSALTEKGYTLEWRILRSCDYGDPTIRRRLFVQAVRDACGKTAVWPDPTHDKGGEVPGKVWAWPSARDHVIDWSHRGQSVFTRKRPLADNTFRRLAIGLVKYGLKEFLSPNFGERPTQQPRTHSLEAPLPTVTSHGAGGLAAPEAYILPKDAGHQVDYTRSVHMPLQTLTTKSHEVLVEPAVIQLKGASTAQSVDGPLTAVTSNPAHYVMQPLVDHLRGTGVAKPVSEPIPTVTSSGSHQALAEAFMMAIDQTGGGKNHGRYGVDSPVRTLVTKANASCIELELDELRDRFMKACTHKGVDISRASTFLRFLIAELHKTGRVDAKPYIYVYYSSGSEGSDIDRPLPTCRTKAGHALVYPAIELDGRLIRIDLFYRMLTNVELQKAMGFPVDMKWAGKNKTEITKAIGNSVTHGLARALGLAWYSQESNIRPFVEHIYGK